MEIKASLDSIQATAGLLLALGTSIAALWIVVARPTWVEKAHFRQARNIGTLIIAIGLALIFVLWGNRGSAEDRTRLIEIAQIGVPLCLLAFLINVATQLRRSDKTPGMLRVLVYLFTLIVYVSAGSLSLSASTVMLVVYMKTQAKDGAIPAADVEPVVATVRFTGERIVKQAGDPVMFSMQSGSKNFGCDEPVTAVVQTPLPDGATLVEPPRARWVNVSNARSQSASASVEGATIVARGTIIGLPVTAIEMPFLGRIANCLGGGHGELILTGEYTPRRVGQVPYDTTVTADMTRDRVSRLTLPAASDLTLHGATITFAGVGDQQINASPIVLALGGTAQVTSAENARFKAYLADRQLVIERKPGY